MDREYDIFETVEGGQIWRCSVVGLEASVAKLKELAGQSPNEFMLMHFGTNSVIAKFKSPK
jgi:hypothetical protein